MPPDDPSPDPRLRFSDRVSDYVKYRPRYPYSVVRLLCERAGLAPGSKVADVGSGTGIFSSCLLEMGATVYAVEPNDAMRAAAEVEFGGVRNFVSVAGSAEATSLAAGSVSLVMCAQAFHWFDVGACRTEFKRILTPPRWCALIWNSALPGASAFGVGYECIKQGLGPHFEALRHEGPLRERRCDQLFGNGCWERHAFENSQSLDLEGVRGRLLSSSYAPKEGQPGHRPMMEALDELFQRTQQGGRISMHYSTDVYFGTLD